MISILCWSVVNGLLAVSWCEYIAFTTAGNLVFYILCLNEGRQFNNHGMNSTSSTENRIKYS